MKITYAKFVNFIGIYAGMGLKELEIKDFNIKNHLTMYLGDNGSGKTTLLSLMTPFRETYDDRDEIVLEGEPGYKEIDIQDGEDKYKIRHYYGKKNKSFIEKNGEELNENGGIRTFEATLKEELGVDKEYLKIGRIGSNVTNFIDLKTADRKKYMNRFIPSIDDYLKAFEVAKSKFNEMNKELKSLATRLERYSSIDDLRSTKKAIVKAIKNSDEIVKGYQEEISELKGQITVLAKTVEDITDEPTKYLKLIKKDNKVDSEELARVEDSIETFYNKFENLRNYDDQRIIEVSEETNTQLTEYTVLLNRVIEDIDEIEKEMIKVKNKVSEYEMKRRSYENIDVDSIEKELELNEFDLDYYRKELNTELLQEWDGYTLDRLRKIDTNIQRLQTTVMSIKASTTDGFINKINMSLNYAKKINADEKIYTEKQSRIGFIKHKIIQIDSNKDLLEILDNRPKDCVIDTCPFISRSIDYRDNEYSQLDSLESELKQLEADESKLEKTLNELAGFYELQQSILNAEHLLISIDDKVKGDLTMLDIIKMSSSNFDKTFNVEPIINEFNKVRDIEVIENKIESVKNKLEVAKEKREMYNTMSQELESLEERYNDLSAKRNELAKNRVIYESKTKSMSKKISILQTLKQDRDYATSLRNHIDARNSQIDKIEDTVEVIEEIELEIGELNHKRIQETNNVLNVFKDKLEKADKDITIVEDILARLKDIEVKFDTYKTIKESLDPKSGIPLFFIDNYLKDIATRANELLSLAYDSKFRIKFEITESDFFIQVYKSDGTFLKDISKASQGETSLTNISLSLAMMEKMIQKYNIVYIDEGDSTLSVQNRRIFIDLLEVQRKRLNIEQIHLISHNEEFDSQPLDLILLNGHRVVLDDEEFMEGKNVLFKVGN